MRALAYRIVLTIVNIFFPPMAVIMLTGFGMDTAVNSMCFLLAVIPSHIHGFYISCTYFHRRHKVKKGRYPGGPKSLIYSSNIINGGASNSQVARLYRKEKGIKRSRSRGLSLTREPSDSRPEMGQRFASGHSYRSGTSRVNSSRRGRGWGAQDGYVAMDMDGYGSGRL